MEVPLTKDTKPDHQQDKWGCIVMQPQQMHQTFKGTLYTPNTAEYYCLTPRALLCGHIMYCLTSSMNGDRQALNAGIILYIPKVLKVTHP